MQIAIIGSLILSILHSILFWDHQAGISVLLFMIPAILLLLYVLEKQGKVKNKKAIWLTIPILLLGSTYLLFDNHFLQISNFFAILALTASMIIWMLCDEFKIGLFFSKLMNIVLGPIEFVGDAMKQIKGLWHSPKEKQKNTTFRKVIKAVLISIPIVFIVLMLLISADDTFGHIFKGIEEIILEWLSGFNIFFLFFRIALIVILFIYFVSFLYNLTQKESSFHQIDEFKREKKFKIDPFTINTMLTILNVIYLVFNLIQIWVLCSNSSTDITQYSRSARQGFFQLVIVSFINLALILLSTANQKEEKSSSKNYRKAMNFAMLIFTIGLLIVAFVRMNLYESNYGSTILRLLVYWGILTEAILMVPTFMYLWKEKVNLFQSYFLIVTVMYVILNFARLDSLVAKRNVDRYMETGKVDFYYLSSELGAEAIPQIKRLYHTDESMSKKDPKWEELKKDISRYLYRYKAKQRDKVGHWQSFNFARAQAKEIVSDMKINYNTINTNYNL